MYRKEIEQCRNLAEKLANASKDSNYKNTALLVKAVNHLLHAMQELDRINRHAST